MTGTRRFDGRACFIGGSTGMAASAARALAAEGALVFVASRTAAHARALAAGIERAGGRAAWAAADLSREDEVEAAFAACVDAFRRVDAVYHVAGISGRRLGDGPLHAATVAGWESVIAANARSTFLVCRAAVRRMREQPADDGRQRGAIVTMSSVLARHPAPEHFGTHAYAASKGAIEALTRAAAAYYAPDGIRLNAIAPALVATPMSRRAQEDPAVLAYLAGRQPLAGGPIEPDRITPLALFLLSDEASMITGQVVAVDAGWAVSEGPARRPDRPG